MRALRAFARELRLRFLRATPSVWIASLVLLLGPQLALWSTALAGNAPRPIWTLAVLGLSLMHALLPDSLAGTAALAIPVAWWGWGLTDGMHPAILLAGLGLVAAHVAGLLLAAGPETMRLDGAVVRRWLLRGSALFVTVPVLWVAGEYATRLPQTGVVWAAALVVLLVAVLLVRLLTQDSDETAAS